MSAGRVWIADHAIIIVAILLMGSMDSFPLHYLMLKSYQPRWEKGELRSLWRLLLTPMDWLRWSGRRSRFFILILPLSFFIFNLMTIGWLPLSGKRWFRCVVNILIVFCKIKRLTDRIMGNHLQSISWPIQGARTVPRFRLRPSARRQGLCRDTRLQGWV